MLNAVRKACPTRIQELLIDDGKECTLRLFGSRARQTQGEREIDQLCASLGIELRPPRPTSPRTSAVERCNGRIVDVL